MIIRGLDYYFVHQERHGAKAELAQRHQEKILENEAPVQRDDTSSYGALFFVEFGYPGLVAVHFVSERGGRVVPLLEGGFAANPNERLCPGEEKGPEAARLIERVALLAELLDPPVDLTLFPFLARRNFFSGRARGSFLWRLNFLCLWRTLFL